MARKTRTTETVRIAEGKKWTVLTGDVEQVCKTLEAESFDAFLSDPPYGISFMGKGWDHDVPSPSLWKEVLRVLKPGAPGAAFSGTRTYHRLAMGMELGGFDVTDMFSWLYGQGWPKGLDVSKAIDRYLGHPRGYVEREELAAPEDQHTHDFGHSGKKYDDEPTTDLGRKWKGWNTQLKPGTEPAAFVWKPKEGTFAENLVKHGVGALDVERSRVGASGGTREIGFAGSKNNAVYGAMRRGKVEAIQKGRYPSNVLLSHLPGCRLVGTRPSADVAVETRSTGKVVSQNRSASGANYGRVKTGSSSGRDEEVWECADGCVTARLDAQSGPRASAKPGSVLHQKGSGKVRTHGDSDLAASKYFHRFAFGDGELDLLAEARERFFYCPKAPPTERGSKNDHATLKPMALMKYLAGLFMPPEPKRILVPFCGSGSEMLGCLLAGWPEVVGIELDPRMADVARWRIENARERRTTISVR